MKQNEIFKKLEGNKYYARNKEKLKTKDDYIIQAIVKIELNPNRILEIGCSNGWRLNLLKEIYGSDCYGIDPSSDAIQDGKKEFKAIKLEQGTADILPYKNDAFDMVIYGFCLYLCDRSDLFKIAYEADRVLQDLGNIVIFDFYAPFPYKNPYSYHQGISSYKMNYANLFLWNPSYNLKYQKVFLHPPLTQGTADDLVSVMILEKNIREAFPDNPFKKS
jgi:ubiquinone/menaquinone biosynthesis C-methylase UbiE